MTREVRFVAWVLAAMLGFRGLDYVTGNTYPMGRAYGEEVAMPTEVSQVLFRLSRWENLDHAQKI